jgi:hypothetical protein
VISSNDRIVREISTCAIPEVEKDSKVHGELMHHFAFCICVHYLQRAITIKNDRSLAIYQDKNRVCSNVKATLGSDELASRLDRSLACLGLIGTLEFAFRFEYIGCDRFNLLKFVEFWLL